jgi:tetratricopeptide (TPR) repeat protein
MVAILVTGASEVLTNLDSLSLLHAVQNRPVLAPECASQRNVLLEPHRPLVGGPVPSLAAGLLYWISGDCESAAGVWRQLVASRPQYAVAWLWLAAADMASGRIDGAARAIGEADAQDYVAGIAIRAYLSQQQHVSERWLALSARSGKSSALAQVYDEVWRYYAIGRRNDALALLEPLALNLPSDSAAQWLVRGMMARVKGDISEAIDLYKRAQAIAPDDTEILYRLRGALLDAGRYQEGLQVALSEAGLEGTKEVYLAVASAYRLTQNYADAQVWAIKALDLDANWWPAYNELGIASCLAGQPEQAQAYFTKALRLSGNHLAVRKSRIECIYLSGGKEEAIRGAEQLIHELGSDVGLISMYLDLGNWYLERGEEQKATDLYRRGLALWPDAHWLQSRLDKLPGGRSP